MSSSDYRHHHKHSSHYLSDEDGEPGNTLSSSTSSGRRKKSSSSSSSKAPKSILKNPNPHASYRDPKLDELVEHERPRIASSSSSSSHHRHHSHGHGGHGHGHSHKRRSHHKEVDDDGYSHGHSRSKSGGGHKSSSSSSSSSSSRHHHRSSKGGSGESSHHHRHGSEERKERKSGRHGHHSSSSSGKSRRERRSSSDAAAAASESIYDQPKVPAVKLENVPASADATPFDFDDESAALHHQPGLYENLGVVLAEEEENNMPEPVYDNTQLVSPPHSHADPEPNNAAAAAAAALYDVPRSNKKVAAADLANFREADVDRSDAEALGELAGECDEALYENQQQLQAGELSQAQQQSSEAYDVPSTAANGVYTATSLSELIPSEYDRPKIRDSLSTIEEEHQEYDIPKVAADAVKAVVAQAALSSSSGSSREELYENQKYALPSSKSSLSQYEGAKPPGKAAKSDDEALPAGSSPPAQDQLSYADFNEFDPGAPTSHGLHAHSHSHHHSSVVDDRSSSSGYRSSSSPSIQSEELYVNESAVASMEDLNLAAGEGHGQSQRRLSSSNSISPEPVVTREAEMDIAIETTLERNLDKDRRKKIMEKELRDLERRRREQELAREKERERAEEIEREIRKRREDNQQVNNSGTSSPFGQRLNSVANSPLRKEKPSAPKPPKPLTAPHHFGEKDQQVFNTYKKAASPESAGEDEGIASPSDDSGKKEKQQKDRSVDVYHETVRQRVNRGEASRAPLSEDVFKHQKPKKVMHFGELPESGERKAAPVEHERRKTKAAAPPPPPPPLPPSPPVYIAVPANDDASLELPSRSDSSVASSPETFDTFRSPSSSADRDEDDEELPCVRQLRSRFEEQRGLGASAGPAPLDPQRKAAALNKIHQRIKQQQQLPGQQPFLVMSSLTRRGAIAISKTLYTGNDEQVTSAKAKTEPRRKSLQTIQEPATFQAPTSQKKGPAPPPPPSKGEEVLQQQQQQQPGRQSEPRSARRDDVGWDPVQFVAKLYRLPRLSSDEVERNSADAARMRGYLERLPPGKKKATMWNSWKRQFFVADSGFLTSYANESSASPLETMELFGGGVDFMDAKVLGVQDRRGHYLVLKCPSEDQTLQWETSLRGNISQDFTRTFVTPSPLDLQRAAPALFSRVLVIDVGGASVRAGVATTIPTLPQLFFPSVMATEHANDSAIYFGLDAFAPEVRSRCRLSSPLASSHHFDTSSLNQTALQGILEKIFKDLNLEPTEYDIQLSVSRSVSEQTKHALAAMLFDEFGVPAVNVGHQTLFAFYSYQAKSGVMVDLGERMDVVPIVDGYKVSAGVSTSPVGGKELRSKLQHYLLGRNYSLTSFIDSFVTRYTVERLAYISRNFDRELDHYRESPASIDAQLEVAHPDSPDAPVRRIEMGSERFEAAEGLFKPELWGLDQAGVHVLVHKAFKECSMDVRKELTQSVFLTGGLTLLPGFRERLETELERLTSPALRPKVHASPYRYHSAYLGACVHATNEDGFQRSKVTKEDWQRGRNKLKHFWNML